MPVETTKTFYVDVSLNKNKLLNVKLHPVTSVERVALASSLTAGDEGMLVYDTDLSTIFHWNGTAWVSVSAGSGSDANYVHIQTVAADTWEITHNLGKFASVSVVDSAGTAVEGDLEYINVNSVRLIFSAPFSGKAYFN